MFDGDCGFCTTSAQAVQRLFPDVDVVPWQRADLTGFGLTPQECTDAVQWIGIDGSRATGAEGIGRLLIAHGPVWAAIGLLAQVPPTSWAAAAVYRAVARNRHRLPGGTPACALPA